MKYVTLAYGPENDWKPVLERWMQEFDRIIPNGDLTVISCGEKWVLESIKKVRPGTTEMKVPVPEFMYHGPLNISGILLAYAAQTFSPCLVVTLDCEILKPVEDGDWMDSAIALGVDNWVAGGRQHKIHNRIITEYSCAVQWCGIPFIGDAFLHLWTEHLTDPRAAVIGCWEQVIWSLVWDNYNINTQASLYPLEMNWSGGVPTKGYDVVIRHYHGKRKDILWKKWGLL
jgi:hypothetical protein